MVATFQIVVIIFCMFCVSFGDVSPYVTFECIGCFSSVYVAES